MTTEDVKALAEALPCEDPEEPCDADGRDAHRWCDNCIARSLLAARGWTLEPSGLREALTDAEAAIAKYADIGRRVGGVSIDPDERPGVAAYAYRLSDELSKVWLEWDDKRRARVALNEEG